MTASFSPLAGTRLQLIRRVVMRLSVQLAQQADEWRV